MRILLSLLLLAVSAVAAKAQSVSCPTQRTVVDIPGGFDHQTQMCLRNLLISSVQTPNTIVRMGPDVVFDFSDVKVPIELGRCVTLTSVADFGPLPVDNACIPIVNAPARAPAVVGVPAPTAQARASNSPGPLLSYGKHPDLPSLAFFQTIRGRLAGGGLPRHRGLEHGGRRVGWRLVVEGRAEQPETRDPHAVVGEIAGAHRHSRHQAEPGHGPHS
jgi:hypothetical protein